MSLKNQKSNHNHTQSLKTESIKYDWLDFISKRIENHISSMVLLENIRWRFISSFGIGAFVAGFFASIPQIQIENRVIALILVYIFSFAGLITQIRIFGLIVNLWDKIREIQHKEFEALNEFEPLEELKNSLYSPELRTYKGKSAHIFSVHMANCLVLSTFIGIATYLLFTSIKFSTFWSIIIGACVWIVIFMSSYFISIGYLSFLKKNNN